MAKVLIVYDSATGNTEQMAREVEQGVRETDVDVELKKVAEVKPGDLEAADGIILGSPTIYGSMSWGMKRLIDESADVWGKLSNKVGAAFSSSALLGGGSETTVLSLVEAMLNHEMIVVGGALDPEAAETWVFDNQGSLYGAISLSAPDEKASNTCKVLGKRVAEVVKKLS